MTHIEYGSSLYEAFTPFTVTIVPIAVLSRPVCVKVTNHCVRYAPVMSIFELTVIGEGDLATVQMPTLPYSDDFKLYDPQVLGKDEDI